MEKCNSQMEAPLYSAFVSKDNLKADKKLKNEIESNESSICHPTCTRRNFPRFQCFEWLGHHNEMSYPWRGLSCSQVISGTGRWQEWLPEGLYRGGVKIFHGGQHTNQCPFWSLVLYGNGCVAHASIARYPRTPFSNEFCTSPFTT